VGLVLADAPALAYIVSCDHAQVDPMRRALLVCFLLLWGIVPVAFGRTGVHSPSRSASSGVGRDAGGHAGGHVSKHHSSKSRSSSGHSTGAHSRSKHHGAARRSSGSHAGATHRAGRGQSPKRAARVARDNDAKIKRSQDARAEFQRAYPCPSTGKISGGCPGYVVDHIVPLNRGGADTALNMQWQSENAAKAKDD